MKKSPSWTIKDKDADTTSGSRNTQVADCQKLGSDAAAPALHWPTTDALQKEREELNYGQSQDMRPGGSLLQPSRVILMPF